MQNQTKPTSGSKPVGKNEESQTEEIMMYEIEDGELVYREVDKLRMYYTDNPQKVFIPCERLIIDEKQPFRLYNEDELTDLASRIKKSGLINPIAVRSVEDGMYEILSGRNRARAVMLNGNKEIAAFIYFVDDDKAKMIMLDGEVQRVLLCTTNDIYNLSSRKQIKRLLSEHGI